METASKFFRQRTKTKVDMGELCSVLIDFYIAFTRYRSDEVKIQSHTSRNLSDEATEEEEKFKSACEQSKLHAERIG